MSEERFNRVEEKLDALTILTTETATNLDRLFHPVHGEFVQMKKQVEVHDKYFDRMKWTGRVVVFIGGSGLLGWLKSHKLI